MMKKFAVGTAGHTFAEAIEGAENSLETLVEAAEGVENRFETFARVLSKFLRLRKKLHTGLKVLGNNLRSLEDAESAGEISTLMGLTVLADQRGYNEAAAELMKSYETELLPIAPELTNLLNIGAQANEAAKMINRLFDNDATTGEDDFTRMMTALRDLNFGKFNEIYKRVKQRIEIEESY